MEEDDVVQVIGIVLKDLHPNYLIAEKNDEHCIPKHLFPQGTRLGSWVNLTILDDVVTNVEFLDRDEWMDGEVIDEEWTIYEDFEPGMFIQNLSLQLWIGDSYGFGKITCARGFAGEKFNTYGGRLRIRRTDPLDRIKYHAPGINAYWYVEDPNQKKKIDPFSLTEKKTMEPSSSINSSPQYSVHSTLAPRQKQTIEIYDSDEETQTSSTDQSPVAFLQLQDRIGLVTSSPITQQSFKIYNFWTPDLSVQGECILQLPEESSPPLQLGDWFSFEYSANFFKPNGFCYFQEVTKIPAPYYTKANSRGVEILLEGIIIPEYMDDTEDLLYDPLGLIDDEKGLLKQHLGEKCNVTVLCTAKSQRKAEDRRCLIVCRVEPSTIQILSTKAENTFSSCYTRPSSKKPQVIKMIETKICGSRYNSHGVRRKIDEIWIEKAFVIEIDAETSENVLVWLTETFKTAKMTKRLNHNLGSSFVGKFKYFNDEIVCVEFDYDIANIVDGWLTNNKEMRLKVNVVFDRQWNNLVIFKAPMLGDIIDFNNVANQLSCNVVLSRMTLPEFREPVWVIVSQKTKHQSKSDLSQGLEHFYNFYKNESFRQEVNRHYPDIGRLLFEYYSSYRT